MGTYSNILRPGGLAMLFALPFAPMRAQTCTPPPALVSRGQSTNGSGGTVAKGNWFLVHGQAACAVDAFRSAMRGGSSSPEVLDGLARSYIAASEPASAVELLRHAPPNEVLTVDLANAYEKAGNTQTAGETLVRAVRAHPTSARLASALVLLLANHGQLDQAYELAGNFARLHPRDPNAQKLYLRVLVATNDTAAARPLAKKLLLAAPADGELLYLNGTLERKAGEFDAARGHLLRSVAINPDFADARFNLGLVLQQLGDNKGAREQMQTALSLGDNDPELHLALSKVLRTLGEQGPAEAQLAQYQGAMKARSDDQMASGKEADAEVALKAGEKEKAISLYREALEVKPHDPNLAYGLAMALDAAGDTGSERKVLDTAVGDEPGSALNQQQLGYLLFKSGDYEGAEQHFRLALRAKPDFTQAWINLAATLASRSQFSEAREAADHALLLDPHNAEALQMKRMLPAATSAR